MAAVITVLWVVITLAYPLVVYFGFQHWPPHVLSGVLLGLFGTLVLLRRLAQRAAPQSPDWRSSVVPLAIGSLLLLGAVLRQAAFVKAVPVIVNGALLTIFGLSLRGDVSMVERFARRQDPDLSPSKVAYCRTVTKVWCGFFALNILVTLALATFASTAAWTLYTGLVAYVLIGVMFTVEYIVRKARFRDYPKRPWIHDRLLCALFPPHPEVARDPNQA